ncbi:MAG: hypothetical protein QXK47_05945 [Candidatus Bathyarchaeia archaeon]
MAELDEFKKADFNKKLDIIAEQIIELAKNLDILTDALKAWTGNWQVLNKELSGEFDKSVLNIRREIEKAISKANERALIKRVLAGNNKEVLDYIKRKWAAYAYVV